MLPQFDKPARPVSADGSDVADLFVVGTLRKPAHWESTAVPELRNQAAESAQGVFKVLMERYCLDDPAHRAGCHVPSFVPAFPAVPNRGGPPPRFRGELRAPAHPAAGEPTLVASLAARPEESARRVDALLAESPQGRLGRVGHRVRCVLALAVIPLSRNEERLLSPSGPSATWACC